MRQRDSDIFSTNHHSYKIAQALLAIEAVVFRPENPVKFKSGIISPIYVDNRRLPFFPEQWRLIIEGFADYLEAEKVGFDIIAGVEAAGIPHSAALGYQLKKPSVFVRKQAKEHGTKRRIEGGDIQEKRVLLVEDLVTTGGSSLDAVSALREAGATVTHCLCIVTYGFKETLSNFERMGVKLQALASFELILEVATQHGNFAKADKFIIEDWLNEPIGWAERQGISDAGY